MSLREIVDIIRGKTRDEWSDLSREYITDLRIWLQENGEVGALVGLIAGIFIVLFFKLVVFLIVFGGLIAYTVWHLAEPTQSIHPRQRNENDDPNGV